MIFMTRASFFVHRAALFFGRMPGIHFQWHIYIYVGGNYASRDFTHALVRRPLIKLEPEQQACVSDGPFVTLSFFWGGEDHVASM